MRDAVAGDLREVRARVEFGMATARDARTLDDAFSIAVKGLRGCVSASAREALLSLERMGLEVG